MAIEKLTGTLVYVQVDTPKNCYVEEKGKEWKASIVVSEDDADSWDEEYPKQTAKQVKTSEFESIYKIPAPFEEQRKQYIITLRKNTKLGNGKDVPEQYQPKVFKRDGKVITDVTKQVLVANGSTGQISVETYDGKMGTFARLKNVLVENLIEYHKEGSSGNAGDEFGLELKKEPNEFDTQEEKKPSKATPAKNKKVPEPAEDDSDSLPF